MAASLSLIAVCFLWLQTVVVMLSKGRSHGPQAAFTGMGHANYFGPAAADQVTLLLIVEASQAEAYAAHLPSTFPCVLVLGLIMHVYTVGPTVVNCLTDLACDRLETCACTA